jgi:hypothetical protein
MINFWDVPCTRSDGRPTTHYSDVLAQARDCFIQRLDAAISAADYGFSAIQDLPQGIAVSGDLKPAATASGWRAGSRRRCPRVEFLSPRAREGSARRRGSGVLRAGEVAPLLRFVKTGSPVFED